MTLFEEFKAFVAAKPADETFDRWARNCALGQFLDSKFDDVEEVGFLIFWRERTGDESISSMEYANAIVEAFLPEGTNHYAPMTFGALSLALENIHA